MSIANLTFPIIPHSMPLPCPRLDRNIFYPTKLQPVLPASYYQIREPAIWEEYLRANESYCDMDEESRAKLKLYATPDKPEPYCPPTRTAVVKREEGYERPKRSATKTKRYLESQWASVEGVLLMVVIGMTALAAAGGLMVGFCLLMAMFVEDEEEEEEEGGGGGGDEEQGGEGYVSGRGTGQVDEEGYVILMVEKPKEAKLAAEKYNL